MTRTHVTLARLLSILGVVLVLSSPALGLAQWYSNRAPLRTLDWYLNNRSPGDSAAYASALYHASFARASESARWHLSGYATLATAGTALGIVLLALRSRRGG